MINAFWRLLKRNFSGVFRKMRKYLIVKRNSQRATVSNTHWMAKARKPIWVYTWYFSPKEWPQKKLIFKSLKRDQRTVSMEWTTPLLTGKSKSTTKASLSSPAWKKNIVHYMTSRRRTSAKELLGKKRRKKKIWGQPPPLGQAPPRSFEKFQKSHLRHFLCVWDGHSSFLLEENSSFP